MKQVTITNNGQLRPATVVADPEELPAGAYYNGYCIGSAPLEGASGSTYKHEGIQAAGFDRGVPTRLWKLYILTKGKQNEYYVIPG